MALVKRKAREGKIETVEQPEEAEDSAARSGATILDLTELLQRSLRKGGAPATADGADGKETPKPAARARAATRTTVRTTARKGAAKTASRTHSKRAA